MPLRSTSPAVSGSESDDRLCDHVRIVLPNHRRDRVLIPQQNRDEGHHPYFSVPPAGIPALRTIAKSGRYEPPTVVVQVVIGPTLTKLRADSESCNSFRKSPLPISREAEPMQALDVVLAIDARSSSLVTSGFPHVELSKKDTIGVLRAGCGDSSYR